MTHNERTNRRRSMADLIYNGKTFGEVAGQFGVSMTMVRMAYQEFYPGEKTQKDKTIRIIALLIKTPLTLQEIANIIGVSYQKCQQVRDELLSEGIKLNE